MGNAQQVREKDTGPYGNLQNGEKYILWGKRQTDTHTERERAFSRYSHVCVNIYIYLFILRQDSGQDSRQHS